MIFGQGELIPYEVDVAAAIGLLLLALDMREREALQSVYRYGVSSVSWLRGSHKRLC
jgi:hypothetical protein